MNDTMQNLKYDVKWHLDRDCLSSMMGTGDQNSWLFFGMTSFGDGHKGNVPVFVAPAEATDRNHVRELHLKLVNDYQ